MQKFRLIIQDAEEPQTSEYLDRFPPPPATVSRPEDRKRWRVQCLLMMAEFRYSMYLDLLDKKFAGIVAKEKWPLPPW